MSLPNFTEYISEIPIDMVFVQGDGFAMGKEDVFDASPEHPVEVQDFYISRTLVCQELMIALTKSNPSRFRHPLRPVERVSWQQCSSFFEGLQKQTQKKFRLPTEAEWEYAAQGGRYAKPKGKNLRFGGSWNKHNAHACTHPIALKYPNALGLYDMMGNVEEWCSDWFDENYYRQCLERGTAIDPQGSPTGQKDIFAEYPDKITKGGSWQSEQIDLHPSSRSHYINDGFFRMDSLGFRICISASDT